MKKIISFPLCWLFIILVNVTAVASGQSMETGDDRTLSPYFFIKSDDPALDQLPLKSTSADVSIAGVIADVKVKQVYRNTGKRVIEAIYVFPGSTRAAVHGMKMRIGERTIVAKIEERAKARQEYQTAMQEGKSASLLEQQRPNVFQMNVGNIQPGDEISVELEYTELLVPEDGVYEFAYPTVVGPRYSNQPAALASTDEFWVANPYTKEGEKPFYTFDLKAYLTTGIPIKDIKCPSHQVNVTYNGPSKAAIELDPAVLDGGNRDFILKYRLKGKEIETGLVLYEGENENFFLLMMQPPERILPEQMPAREYIFIVDVSGSMSGFPLDISKELLRDLIGKLRPEDKFNVVLFAGGSTLMSERSVPASEVNISNAINIIANQRGGGGTNLLPALQTALNLPGPENISRTVVIATDGYVTVEKEAFDLIRNNLGKANFFSFGIGSAVNRYIIEGMAHVGAGEPFVITKPGEARSAATRFRQYIESPVLTDIKLAFNGMDVYDAEPLNIPDVFAERPVIIFGKYKGEPSGNITLSGISGRQPWSQTIQVSQAKKEETSSALKYLWARNRIRLIDDYSHVANSEDRTAEVTSLGLKYNLLTAHTSFVAVDTEVRGDGTTATVVRQPLPLPEGVGNNAIGGNTGAYSMASGGTQNLQSTTVTTKAYQHVKTNGSSGGSAGGSGEQPKTAAVKDELNSDRGGVDIAPGTSIPEKAEEVFTIVEDMPAYPGGEYQLQEFLEKNLRYPVTALAAGVQGTVYVTFVIGKDGKIRDARIQRGISADLDAEALRVIKLMPPWEVGKQNGRNVSVQYTLPVKFSLK